MSEHELNAHLIPLMQRKVPLQRIITSLPGATEESIIAAFDNLMFEAYEIDLAYCATA